MSRLHVFALKILLLFIIVIVYLHISAELLCVLLFTLSVVDCSNDLYHLCFPFLDCFCCLLCLMFYICLVLPVCVSSCIVHCKLCFLDHLENEMLPLTGKYINKFKLKIAFKTSLTNCEGCTYFRILMSFTNNNKLNSK